MIECSLKDIIISNETLFDQVFFTFNDTTVLLGKENLEIIFSVRDGGSGNVSAEYRQLVALDAIGEFLVAAT